MFFSWYKTLLDKAVCEKWEKKGNCFLCFFSSTNTHIDCACSFPDNTRMAQTRPGAPTAWVFGTGIAGAVVRDYAECVGACAGRSSSGVGETFAVLHGVVHESLLARVALQPVEAAPSHRARERDSVARLARAMEAEAALLCAALSPPAPAPPPPRTKDDDKEGEEEEDAGTACAPPGGAAAAGQGAEPYSGAGLPSQPGVPPPACAAAKAFFTSESDLRLAAPVRLRGLRWRVLLGGLARDWRTWRSTAAQQRADYAALRARLVDGNGSGGEGEEEEEGDVARLRREIERDIVRTYTETAFFQRGDVRRAMLGVLLVYARLHPELQYVQGMNEILAPLLFAVCEDCTLVQRVVAGARDSGIALTATTAILQHHQQHDTDEDGNGEEPLWPLLADIAAEDATEADAYSLFCRVMDTIGDWFVSPKEVLGDADTDGGDGGGDSVHRVDEARVVAKCLEIQKLLLAKDYELAVYLQELGIQPQLYMLRWVRILLSQVFPLPDLLLFWDAIFASGPPFVLVDHLCVTMLSLVRTAILGRDYPTALSVLFHYPAAANPPTLILSIALNSLRSGINPFFAPAPLPAPTVALHLPPLFPCGTSPVAISVTSPATSGTTTPRATTPHHRRVVHPPPLPPQQQPAKEPAARSLGNFLMSTFSRAAAAHPPQTPPPKAVPSPSPSPSPRAVAAPVDNAAAQAASSWSATARRPTSPARPLTFGGSDDSDDRALLEAVLAANVSAAERLQRVAFALSSDPETAAELDSIRKSLATSREAARQQCHHL